MVSLYLMYSGDSVSECIHDRGVGGLHSGSGGAGCTGYSTTGAHTGMIGLPIFNMSAAKSLLGSGVARGGGAAPRGILFERGGGAL